MSFRYRLLGGISALLLASPVRCQFSGLSATDDGNQVYFTSQMLLRGAKPSSPWDEARLYRFASGSVTLFAERGSLAPQGAFSSIDGVAGPTISGDGTLVAFTLNNVCLTGPNCTESVNEAELRGNQNLDLGPGTTQLSRNGRWALVANHISTADYNVNPPTLTDSYTTTLIDLTTGQRTSVSSQPAPGSFTNSPLRTLASEGSALIATTSSGQTDAAGGGFNIWKQGYAAPVRLPPGVTPFALSDDASTVLYYVYPSGLNALYQMGEFNIASGKSSVIFQGENHSQLPVFLSMTNSGQRVLYEVWTSAADGPAYLWDASSVTAASLPLDAGEFATAGSLTGPGDYAFVATTHLRIVKFSLQSGASVSLFTPTPYCDDPGAVGGGSMVQLHCSFASPLADLQGTFCMGSNPCPFLPRTQAGSLYRCPGSGTTSLLQRSHSISRAILRFSPASL